MHAQRAPPFTFRLLFFNQNAPASSTIHSIVPFHCSIPINIVRNYFLCNFFFFFFFIWNFKIIAKMQREITMYLSWNYTKALSFSCASQIQFRHFAKPTEWWRGMEKLFFFFVQYIDRELKRNFFEVRSVLHDAAQCCTPVLRPAKQQR